MYASPEKEREKKTEITNLTNATVAKEPIRLWHVCYLYNIAFWIFVCSCLMIRHRFFASCLTLLSVVLLTHTHMKEPQIVSHVWKLYKILYELVCLFFFFFVNLFICIPNAWGGIYILHVLRKSWNFWWILFWSKLSVFICWESQSNDC